MSIVGREYIIDFLNEIRRPIKISLWKNFLYSTLLFILGFILGLISKVNTTLNQLTISVFDFNPMAKHIYEKVGFEPYRVDENELEFEGE